MLVYYNTNTFFEMSSFWPSLFSSLIKFLVFLSITFSFRSFIVSFCPLNLLHPDIDSPKGLFMYGISRYVYLCMKFQKFPDMCSSWSVSS